MALPDGGERIYLEHAAGQMKGHDRGGRTGQSRDAASVWGDAVLGRVVRMEGLRIIENMIVPMHFS